METNRLSSLNILRHRPIETCESGKTWIKRCSWLGVFRFGYVLDKAWIEENFIPSKNGACVNIIVDVKF